MYGTRHLLAILSAAALLAACGGDEHKGYANSDDDPAPRPAAAAPAPAPAPPPPPVLTAADSAAAVASVAAQADSVRAAMQKVRVLGASEIGRLRQDVNKKQIATARQLGQRASGEAQIQQLVRAGRLVALGDSTEWWVLRKMDHSSPYVTPDARANLVEIGRRFHARLDSAGLPHYRMKVTSAIRTDASQAELRRINSYASRIVSAHEFGTTIDVSHERFAVPAPRPGDAAAVARARMLEEVGKENGKPLQALLGRTLLDLRDAGALHVMIEDQQPVYHFTVARRYPAQR
ncbi:MAG TPA: DUF5715 family protein [Longimicrobium sp.]|jgi:hypothetical protein|uniref:DUF5715 family protein n=1 Tax=Longimicrobium sp. TaxID=2029185 RepID=UPI002ED7F611